VIQHLFTAYSMRPVPLPPRDPAGHPVRPNGETTFDLATAVQHFGVAEHTLRQLFGDALGPLLTDADARELGVARQSLPHAVTKRRILSDADVAMMADADLLPPREHERELFIAMCERAGADPLRQQIYWTYRRDPLKHQFVFSVELRVDGLRAMAQQTGEILATKGPFFSGDGERWLRGWVGSSPPPLARYGVKRRGRETHSEATAAWGSYVVRRVSEQSGEEVVDQFWCKMPDHMLGKCAEALAYRRAFPELFSGLYIKEELDQMENPTSDPPGNMDDDCQLESQVQGDLNQERQLAEPPSARVTTDVPLNDERLTAALSEIGLDEMEQQAAVRAYRERWPTLFSLDRPKFNQMLLRQVRLRPRSFKLRVSLSM